MRIIRSQSVGVISKENIDSIVMEMVNIYHGIQYYDPVRRAELKAPIPGYLTHTHGNFTDEIIPVKGYIYVHIANGAAAAIKQINKNLVTKFNQFNRWGRRKLVYEYIATTNVLCTAAQSTDEAGLSIIGTVAKTKKLYGGPVKGVEMEWVISDDAQLFKYREMIVDELETYQIVGAASTIVIDAKHTIPVPDKATLSFPSFPSHIKMLRRPIRTAKPFGYEAGVWDAVYEAIHGAPSPTYSIVAQKLDRDVYEYDDALGFPVVERCSVCNVYIWGEYYHCAKPDAETKGDAAAPVAAAAPAKRGRGQKAESKSVTGADYGVCRFCAHYTSYEFARADIITTRKSPVKVMNVLLGFSGMDPDTRDALKQLLTQPLKQTPVPGTDRTEMRSGVYVLGKYGPDQWQNIVASKSPTIIFYS